jgi:hypothetical protein
MCDERRKREVGFMKREERNIWEALVSSENATVLLLLLLLLD